eukprot:CAMPEP_0182585204 /NCGR_PEP_ID=MMETSP1324-20130603/59799_1 /TAXON_ID=236786 /ORGANISM="Florenciella sp., Strain RCC1587" /LENGTH=224 /DNA_ID=CAMNT_0024801983 /DNA_START=77 /DNA_END=747 /DNA_ORIENTATION=+
MPPFGAIHLPGIAREGPLDEYQANQNDFGPDGRSFYYHKTLVDIPKDIFNEIMGAEFGSTRFHGNIRHLEGVAIPTSPDDHAIGIDKPGRFALLVITDTEMLLYEMKDGHAGTNSWGTKVKQRRKEPVQPLFQFDLTQINDVKIDHRHNGEDKYSLFWTQAKWVDKFDKQAMHNVPSSAFGVSVLYSDAHQVDTTNQLQMITVERKSNLSYHVRSAWKKAHVLR